MSQSPLEATSREEAFRYQQGWTALNRLLHQDRSFSGHERHCAFLNTAATDAAGRFACISGTSGLDFAEDGRALAPVDWDFDGRLDLWITHRTAPRLRLMRNLNDAGNHFVAILLKGDGQETNRDAIGARIEMIVPGSDQRLVKTLHAGDGFLSQTSKWMLFGLGQATEIEAVRVRWPGGRTEEFHGLQADAHYVLSQSSGQATLWMPPDERKTLVASEPRVFAASPEARIVPAARLLLPDIYTHDHTEPLGDRLPGPTLLCLWSQTCAPCLLELKELSAHAELLRQREIHVVAINLDHLDEPGVREDDTLARLGFPFAAEQGTDGLVRSLDVYQRAFLDRWRDLPLPSSFLVDGNKKVAVIYQGPVGVERLLEDANLLDVPLARLRDVATPFKGNWIAPPPMSDPMRVVSQFINSAMVQQGVDYLQLYASRAGQAESELGGRKLGDVHHVLGMLLRDQGQDDAAIEVLIRAVQISPDDIRMRNDLASLLAKQGRLDQAAVHLQAALVTTPDDGPTTRKLALLEMARGRLPEAIKLFEQLVEQQSDDVASLYNLANAYRRTGQLLDAIRLYRQIVDSDPRMILAANNLAWIRATNPDAELRDGVEAVELAEAVCRLTNHRQPEFLDTLAVAYAEAGDFDRAVETAQQAIELMEESGRAETAQQIRARLKQFQERQPYRDTAVGS